MKQVHASQRIPSKFEQENPSDTRLKGYTLLFARTAWVVVAAFSMFLFLLGLPSYAAQLHTICTTSVCYLDGALSPNGVQALRALGVSVETYIWYTIVVTVIVALIWASMGFVIFWHRSNDWMALLTALFLLIFNLTLTDGPTTSLVHFFPNWNLPIACLDFLGTLLEGLFFFLFPNGRFAPRWMRWIFVLLFVQQITSYFLPPNWAVLLDNLVALTFFCTTLFSQIYRYRRVSTLVERQQTKWVLFGIFVSICGGVALTLALTFAPSLYLQSGLFDVANDTLWFIVILPVPLSIGVAMLRYRLWDIDIIINRTLVYGTLTACIVGIYALIVGTLSTFLQAQGNFLISLLATGLVAVLFHPLRERLQRIVNRLFYGQRDEPYSVISQLGSRLEATLAPEQVLPTIVETITHALKLPYAAIILPSQENQTVQASVGTPKEEFLRLPLRYQSEQVGELLLAPRAAGESFSSRDQHLLEDLASQIGIAVYSVQLTTDLQHLTSDLQRSRTQLVTTREEERRRLRRDLHDGLGSVLASLNLRTGAIRAQLERDPVTAEVLLEEQQGTIRSAIADIRRLVYNLRPPSLDELGLVGALRERAAHYTVPIDALADKKSIQGLQIIIEVPENLPVLPAAVEVATYRIVQEAWANVVRHAQASMCWLQLSIVNETLQVEITDNGVGLPAEAHVGVGLLSMRERAAELGGSCQIQPGPEGGTQIHVSLPILID